MIDAGRKEVGRRVSMIELLHERGIKPNRSHGGRHLYCCPLHSGDKTPSFCIYDKDDGYQDFFCYGCKAYGDVVALKAMLDRVPVSQAFAELAARCGFDPNNPNAVIDDCLAMLGSSSGTCSSEELIRSKIVELTSAYRVYRMLGVPSEDWIKRWVIVDDAARAGDASQVLDAGR